LKTSRGNTLKKAEEKGRCLEQDAGGSPRLSRESHSTYAGKKNWALTVVPPTREGEGAAGPATNDGRIPSFPSAQQWKTESGKPKTWTIGSIGEGKGGERLTFGRWEANHTVIDV